MSMFSTTNEGTADRAIRVGLGLLLIAVAVTVPTAMWAWIGIVPLVTGIAGFCPLYRVFGFSSCAR